MEHQSCVTLEQIAAEHQLNNQFENAKVYYEKALGRCSDNLLSMFQLGICYFLTMEREKGEKLMDEAIQLAKEKKELDSLEMFQQEKKLWLEKWDLVPELEWNKE